MYQPSVRLGSQADCEVVITPEISPIVSRQHALVDLTDDGVYITDLNSTNGTYLNGKKLTERTLVQPADEIRLGMNGPIVRAFAIEDQPGAEGTIQESAELLSLSGAPAPGKMAPPPPVPFAVTAGKAAPSRTSPPPLPPRRDRDDDASVAARPRAKAKKTNPALILGIGGGSVLIAGLIGFLVWRFAIRGSTNTTTEEPSLTSEQVFKELVKSSTYIEVTVPGKRGAMTGTGCLIDRERKLVLTAYHVINAGPSAKINVYFAKYAKDGELLSSMKDYGPTDAIGAKVLISDASKDLAILELDSVPKDARVTPLAAASPKRGEEVHTVGGSPEASIGLWIYTKGNVREVQETEKDLKDNTGKIIQHINAWVISTTNPINQGDSGGALVNKRCELVGVCSSLTEGVALVRSFIDIREVKKMVENSSKSGTNPVVIPRKEESKVVGGIDRNKVIGRWSGLVAGVIVEFTRNGQFVMTGDKGSVTGSYLWDGNKINISLNVKGKTIVDVMTVKSLTDYQMVIADPQGKEQILVREK